MIKRNKYDKIVFESENELAALGYIKCVVSYLEPFEEGLHNEEDKGRYYIFNGIKTTYLSQTYNIPK